MPAAAATFSTTIDWPMSSLMRCAWMRALTSTPPPAANGTMSVIGRAGQSCAVACAPSAMTMAAASIVRCMRIFLSCRHSRVGATGSSPSVSCRRGQRPPARYRRYTLPAAATLLHRFRWERRVHHQDPWSAAQARDRRDVADKIEAKVVVQCRVERVNRRNVEQRVAVRRRAHDCFGGDIAAGARPVLDDEWLTETLRQRLTDKARNQVCRTTRRPADYQVHRPCRIGLRPCKAQHGWQRGSARCQM